MVVVAEEKLAQASELYTARLNSDIFVQTPIQAATVDSTTKDVDAAIPAKSNACLFISQVRHSTPRSL